MKKIYGFLGALALLTMASCSKDVESGAPAPEVSKGEMFMTMNIVQQTLSRTTTPGQGKEVGKSYENKVADVLIVFGKKDASDNIYKVFGAKHVSEGSIIGDSPYAATFEMDRATLATDIASSTTTVPDSEAEHKGEKYVEYGIFLIANPTDGMVTRFTDSSAKNKAVQDVFTLSTDADGANSYWKKNHFLMTNALERTVKIYESDVTVPKHNVSTDPLKLGTVTIQRAMSRFDIDVQTEYTVFSAENPKNALKKINLSFDGFALINEAAKATLFKVTSGKTEDDSAELEAEHTAYDPLKTLSFNTEKVNNYVFSPEQTDFLLPLFTGTVTNGAYPAETPSVDLETLDFTEVFEFDNNELHPEDETFTYPGETDYTDQSSYRIWRYCMENTNYNADNQIHGNSTGIVLRARMTGENLDGSADVYAFGGVILGTAEGLRDYAVNDKDDDDNSGVYELVYINYKAAVAAYNATKQSDSDKLTYEYDYRTKKDETKNEEFQPAEGSELDKGYKDIRDLNEQELKALNSFLVAQKFAIYTSSTIKVKKAQQPEQGPTEYDNVTGYWCYYIYWNRHNDNNSNTEMGPMEFATVRNNVYKIRINSVNGLGHPGKPDNDPDKPKPEDPDEEDHYYIAVDCEILPWDVRLNGLDL